MGLVTAQVSKMSRSSPLNLLIPKDPDISQERDFPYIPILGMGLEPEKSYSREDFGFLGHLSLLSLKRLWEVTEFSPRAVDGTLENSLT